MIRDNVLFRAAKIAREEGPFALARATEEWVRFEACKQKKTRIKPLSRYLAQRLRYGSAAPKRYRLIHIDPTDVEYLLTPHFWYRLSKFSTHIRNGDWDRCYSDETVMLNGRYEGFDDPALIKFDNYQLYLSAKKHFEEGIPWTETELYGWLMEEWLPMNLDTSQNWYGSKERIDSTLESFDELYHHIRKNGYLTQRELRESDDSPLQVPDLVPEHHEVTINIGRDGELIFDDGRHRFIAARILGLDTIPVRVLVRHREWQNLRKTVHDSSSPDDLFPKTKRHLQHPDMQDVVSEDLRSE